MLPPAIVAPVPPAAVGAIIGVAPGIAAIPPPLLPNGEVPDQELDDDPDDNYPGNSELDN